MKVLLWLVSGLIACVIVAWLKQMYRLRNHTGLDRGDFVAHFRALGIDYDISSTVYETFKGYAPSKTFAPAPSDNIEQVYRLDDLSFELERILKQLGCELPTSAVLQEWDSPIETVQDAVLWVAWAHAKQDEPGMII